MAKLKLTNRLCDEICNDIKAGVPIKHAAISHGITEVTFYNWYNKGKKAKKGKKIILTFPKWKFLSFASRFAGKFTVAKLTYKFAKRPH